MRFPCPRIHGIVHLDIDYYYLDRPNIKGTLHSPEVDFDKLRFRERCPLPHVRRNESSLLASDGAMQPLQVNPWIPLHTCCPKKSRPLASLCAHCTMLGCCILWLWNLGWLAITPECYATHTIEAHHMHVRRLGISESYAPARGQ